MCCDYFYTECYVTPDCCVLVMENNTIIQSSVGFCLYGSSQSAVSIKVLHILCLHGLVGALIYHFIRRNPLQYYFSCLPFGLRGFTDIY